ncbi:MAG: hypothetical protein WC399_01935 [Bacilli bacterium]|jgi:hypothetical protein
MNFRLIAVITLTVAGSFVQDDPSGPWHSFINVYAPPYQSGSGLEIPFSYLTNVPAPTYIEIYFDSADYHHALVYSRYFERLLNFTSSIALPPFLLETEAAQLTFEAHNADFNISQTLPIYRRETVEVNQFASQGETWARIENISFIDFTGTAGTAAEMVIFKGFLETLSTPTYGRFPLESLSFAIVNPSDQTPTVSDIDLLVGDHSNDFPLLEHTADGQFAVVKAKFVKSGNQYSLGLASDLYINPITFVMAEEPIDGFVPCAGLYFPKDRSQSLQMVSFRIEGSVAMLNRFHFRYDGIHYFERPLIGSCAEAAYCITTDGGGADVGLWKEIIVTDA